MARHYWAVAHGVQTNGVWDPGCTYAGRSEADISYRIAAHGIPVLQKYGVDVRSDFFTGNDKNIVMCVEEANNLRCDTYTSYHVDSANGARGILPIVMTEAGELLANSQRASLLRQVSIPDRGNLWRDDYEVRATSMPAVIFEMGVIQSDADFSLMWDHAAEYGAALAYGVLDYFGIAYDAGQTVIPPAESQQGTADDDWDVWYDWIYVQYFLHICNYMPDLDFDGIPGPATRRGIGNAQRAYQIDDDEVWGPVTDKHAREQVLCYQQILQRLRYYKGDLDGIAGPMTFKAVQDFQRDNGLDPDGCVGEKTYPVLMAA